MKATLLALPVGAWVACASRVPTIECEARQVDGQRFAPYTLAIEVETKTVRLASTTDRLRTARVVSRNGAYDITFPMLPGALRLSFRIDRRQGLVKSNCVPTRRLIGQLPLQNVRSRVGAICSRSHNLPESKAF